MRCRICCRHGAGSVEYLGDGGAGGCFVADAYAPPRSNPSVRLPVAIGRAGVAFAATFSVTLALLALISAALASTSA